MRELHGVQIERLKDLLCCAFEGGSNYWIDLVEVPPKAKRPAEMEFWHEAPIYKLSWLSTTTTIRKLPWIMPPSFEEST